MRQRSLTSIAVCFSIVYAINAVHYGWTPTPRTTIDDILAWTTAIVLAVLYWAGFRMLREAGSHSFRQVMLGAMPLVAISFATIPYDSSDVFLYMDVGWAQVHYSVNPYTHVLRDIPHIENDPMIRSEWMVSNKNPWLDLPFVYGFTFAALVRFVAWLGRGNWWATLVLLKMMNVGAYVVTARLLWSLAKSLERVRPDRAVYLFAWSPLILQHHIANAHNDLLVGSLVVFCVWLLSTRLQVLAPAMITLATLIKYATLPLIPLTFLFLARRTGWFRVIQAAGISVVAVAAVGAPYVLDISRFRFDLISAQLSKVTAGSIYAFLFYIYRVIAPGSLETFGVLLKLILWLIGITLIVRECVRHERSERKPGRAQPVKDDPSIVNFIETCSVILFAIVFVASSQFYSWYIGMLFPIALLLPDSHWLKTFITYAATTHILSLTSLSRKGIGHFALTTAPALVITAGRRLTADKKPYVPA